MNAADIASAIAVAIVVGPILVALAVLWLRMCWWAIREAWRAWDDA